MEAEKRETLCTPRDANDEKRGVTTFYVLYGTYVDIYALCYMVPRSPVGRTPNETATIREKPKTWRSATISTITFDRSLTRL
jgi:hypothetical protein